MASATTSSSDHRHLHLESIAQIDLRLLSQSELLSLSLSASSPADRRRRCDDDVLIPKIDRSAFNESAGSRKQTYSRLRLAPPRNSQPSTSATLPFAALRAADPVDEENTRIIGLLRELFAAEASSSSGDLVPIEVECREPVLGASESLLQDVPIAVVHDRNLFRVSEPGCSNVAPQHVPTAVVDGIKKRKRGRPRKYENQMIMSELGSKPMVVYEEKDSEKEMVLVNKNGALVDLAALGNSQDPFGEEFRRRTQGLDTEDELLEFLSGLNGEWGSSRKKRKIVDASDFGDALPRGWKLMLCIKRRGGQLWLTCRRYISPNGQQFVSCKEVSSYLVTYFGLQDTSLADYVHRDGNIQLACKQIVVDLSCKDDKNACSSVTISPLVSDHGKQVTLSRIGAPMEFQSVDILKCHKCTMTFTEKDDLLHHLLTSHKRDSKMSKPFSSVSEEVIMKDGKYECQFCRKQFDKRSCYYGHLGVHIKEYVKKVDASAGAVSIRRDIGTTSPTPEVSRMQASCEIDPDTAVSTMKNSKSLSQSSRIAVEKNAGTGTRDETHAKQTMETKTNNGKVEKFCNEKDNVFDARENIDKVEEATAIDAANLNCLGAETFSYGSKNNVITESSNDNNIVKCAKSEKSVHSGQDIDSQSCLLVPPGNEVLFIRDDINGASINSLAKYEEEPGTGKTSLTVEDKEKIWSNKNIEDRSFSSKIEKLHSIEGNEGRRDKAVYGFSSSCTKQEYVHLNVKHQKGDISSVVPNGIEQGYVNNRSGISTSSMGKSVQGWDFECNLPTTSASEKTLAFNTNVNRISSSLDEPRFDKIEDSWNNDFTISFGNNHIWGNETALTSNGGEESCQINPEVPFLNEQTIAIENSINGDSSSRLVQLWRENRSDSDFLILSAHDDNLNKTSSSTADRLEAEVVRSQCSSNLSISFGYSRSKTGALEGLRGIPLQRSAEHCSIAFPECEKFSISANNATGSHCNGVEDLKQKRGSEICLSSSSGNVQVSDNENNKNKVFSSTVQEETGMGTVEAANLSNLANGSDSHTHSSVDVMLQVLWRTGQENMLHSDPVRSSAVHPSSCFPTFSMMPDKGGNGSFGVNEKLDNMSRFKGLKSGQMKHGLVPSEISSPSEQTKFMSYDSGMEQRFNPASGLQKDFFPQFPETADRQRVANVCIWCGNEFQHEASSNATQSSSIGSLCATCNAKFCA